MIKIDSNNLAIMKKILGEIYLDNGNTSEVVTLSQAIDNIIVSVQKNIINREK